jgi:hypothetical protein
MGNKSRKKLFFKEILDIVKVMDFKKLDVKEEDIGCYFVSQFKIMLLVNEYKIIKQRDVNHLLLLYRDNKITIISKKDIFILLEQIVKELKLEEIVKDFKRVQIDLYQKMIAVLFITYFR